MCKAQNVKMGTSKSGPMVCHGLCWSKGMDFDSGMPGICLSRCLALSCAGLDCLAQVACTSRARLAHLCLVAPPVSDFIALGLLGSHLCSSDSTSAGVPAQDMPLLSPGLFFHELFVVLCSSEGSSSEKATAAVGTRSEGSQARFESAEASTAQQRD